jgi:hypothetical protein
MNWVFSAFVISELLLVTTFCYRVCMRMYLKAARDTNPKAPTIAEKKCTHAVVEEVRDLSGQVVAQLCMNTECWEQLPPDFKPMWRGGGEYAAEWSAFGGVTKYWTEHTNPVWQPDMEKKITDKEAEELRLRFAEANRKGEAKFLSTEWQCEGKDELQ